MTQRSSCSIDYATPPGQPCVPGGGDLRCSDLATWGISEVRIVGQDVYGFDADHDGKACETSVPAKVTEFGKATRDAAPIGLIFAVALLAALCVLPVRWAVRLYRQASSDVELRGLKFSIALTMIAGIPLVLVGGFLFSTLGIK